MLLCGLTACFLPGKFPPVDTSGPGWRIQQGEALWKPNHKIPELAGEIVFATNPDGRCLLEFTKTTLPVAAAQCSTTNWAIDFPPRKLAFSGKGRPPSRLGWLQLCRALRGQSIAAHWKFQTNTDGTWRLENPKTGESVQGVLSP